MTKICTTLRMMPPTGETMHTPAGQAAVVDAKIVDVSTVDDDHQFGVDDDGLMHVEGKIVAERINIAPSCDPPAVAP